MPNYYTPGVYIEEINTGPRPIEAVATAVAAFVGFAPYSRRSDVNRPVLITSWTQYVERFGAPINGRREPFMKGAYLSHAIYGFFLNGGSRCYVTRVLPPDALDITPPALTVKSAKKKEVDALVIKAKPGLVSDKPNVIPQDIEVSIERRAGSNPADAEFTVRVRMGELQEKPLSFKIAPDAPSSSKKGSDNTPPADASTASPPPPPSVKKGDLLQGQSKLITIEADPDNAKASLEERLPKPGFYTIAVPQPNSLDGLQERDIIGEVSERSGVAGTEIADDVTMVCCPDLMSPLLSANGEIDVDQIKRVQLAMINHCELAGDRMAILDAPLGLEPLEVEQWRAASPYDSMFAALYYPWITVANPIAEDDEPKSISVPPCGHIAGIYARNDSERGVHKAPANEVVRGALELTQDVTKGEQEGLNPNGINCIRAFPGRGIRVWGARTLSSDPAWRYVNVRRLFNMVERSIERNTQWVVFEPNEPGLWSRIRRDVGAFLTVLWRDGMLFGNTPQEAFYVKCDVELNPQESRDMGRLIIEVGLAPIKPAEFVVFKFSQIAAGGS